MWLYGGCRGCRGEGGDEIVAGVGRGGRRGREVCRDVQDAQVHRGVSCLNGGRAVWDI